MRKFSFPSRNFPDAYAALSDVSSRTNDTSQIAECREIAIDLTAQFFFLECTFDVTKQEYRY